MSLEAQVGNHISDNKHVIVRAPDVSVGPAQELQVTDDTVRFNASHVEGLHDTMSLEPLEIKNTAPKAITMFENEPVTGIVFTCDTAKVKCHKDVEMGPTNELTVTTGAANIVGTSAIGPASELTVIGGGAGVTGTFSVSGDVTSQSKLSSSGWGQLGPGTYLDTNFGPFQTHQIPATNTWQGGFVGAVTEQNANGPIKYTKHGNIVHISIPGMNQFQLDATGSLLTFNGSDASTVIPTEFRPEDTIHFGACGSVTNTPVQSNTGCIRINVENTGDGGMLYLSDLDGNAFGANKYVTFDRFNVSYIVTTSS